MLRENIKYWFAVLLMILASLYTNGQENEPFVTEFNPIHGIPSMQVNCMATDSLGYLWLGSNRGLHKFDGKRLITFSHDPADSSSIVKGRVNDIKIDDYGDIYFTVIFGGVYKFDTEAKFFSEISADDEFKYTKGSDFNLVLNSSEKLYVSQRSLGFFEIDLDSKSKKHLVKGNAINTITMNPNNTNQIAVAGDSLFLFDTKAQKLELLSPYYSSSVVFDAYGNLWYVGKFDKVLYKYDMNDKKEIEFDSKAGKNIFFEKILYHNNALWITSNNGLWNFDLAKKTFQLFDNEQDSKKVDFSNTITDIFVDAEDRIWFAKGNKLHLIDPLNQNFTKIPFTEDYYYFKSAQLKQDEYLFVAFYANELHVINVKEKTLNKVVNPIDTLYSLFDVARVRDEVWLFYVNGIAIMDVNTRKIRAASFGGFDKYLGEIHKKVVFVDESENIWIEDLNNPFIFRINPETMEMDSIHYTIDSKFPTTSSTFFNNKLVLGVEKGLIHIDFETREKFITPFEAINIETEFSFLVKIFIESNQIWILTNSAVYKGEINENIVKINQKYEEKGRLTYKQNIDIQRTQKGELLVLTDFGLMVYDEEADRFDTYGLEEGFINIENNIEMEILGDKTFLLSHGILNWKNDKDRLKRVAPSVHIVSFKVGQEARKIDKVLDLKYEENDLEIEFNSVDLSKPFMVQYRYRLHDNDSWIIVDYQNTTAYYSDLRPGDYNFQVASKHKYSDWGKPLSIPFEISPPFWRQWWFILISVFLLGTVIFLYFKSRETEIKKISEMETRMAELENEALRAQMNPHFIFNSLNSIKSYIIDHDREKAADYLTDFSDLIRTILANSRQKSISLASEVEALKLYMDIENTRLEGKFEYEIINSTNSELSKFAIPPLTIQPFIENAIWHGFVHKKGKGKLRIEIKKDKENLLIDIEDDGVGRERSKEIEKKHRRKKSFGILITTQRLEHLRQNSAEDNSIKIIDLKDSQGAGIGTKVIIQIQQVKYQKHRI